MDCVIGPCLEFFLSVIDDMDVSGMYFKQGGATCHIATETSNLLRTGFPKRIILGNSVIYCRSDCVIQRY